MLILSAFGTMYLYVQTKIDANIAFKRFYIRTQLYYNKKAYYCQEQEFFKVKFYVLHKKINSINIFFVDFLNKINKNINFSAFYKHYIYN